MKKFKPLLITAGIALAVVILVFRVAPAQTRVTLLGEGWA